MNWREQIENEVKGHAVFVYAKGEKNMAMCGFSQIRALRRCPKPQ